MTNPRHRPTPGDVYEVKTPKGLGYFQYVCTNREMGELIRVLPGTHHQQSHDFFNVASQEELCFVYFPLAAAVRRNLVRHAGHAALPPHAREHPEMRAPGFIDSSGRVHNWFFWDGERWKGRVDKLTPAQARLSIAEVWNDTLLAERIAANWRPEDWT